MGGGVRVAGGWCDKDVYAINVFSLTASVGNVQCVEECDATKAIVTHARGPFTLLRHFFRGEG